MGHHIYIQRILPLPIPKKELLAGAARLLAEDFAKEPKYGEPGFFRVPGIPIWWYGVRARKDARGPYYERHGMDTVSEYGTKYLRPGKDWSDDDGELEVPGRNAVYYRLSVEMVDDAWDRALYARVRPLWFTLPLETYTHRGKPRGRRNYQYVFVQKLQFNIRVPMSWGQVDINSPEKMLAFLYRLEDAYAKDGVVDDYHNVENLRWMVDAFDGSTVAYIG